MGNQKKRRKKGKSVAIDDYTPETIRRKRKLPKAQIYLMCILVVLELSAVAAMILFKPTPKDMIRQYDVTVEPCSDGTLNIHYDITWTALDEEEPLTWVEVGMPNPQYTLVESSVPNNSSNTDEDGDRCTHCFYFDDAYSSGETVQFSFTINARDMLALSNEGYFYEFVPGWFNEIAVESYTFKWKLSDHVLSHNAPAIEAGYAVWKGSLSYGGYVPMQIRYDDSAFDSGTPLLRMYPLTGAARSTE